MERAPSKDSTEPGVITRKSRLVWPENAVLETRTPLSAHYEAQALHLVLFASLLAVFIVMASTVARSQVVCAILLLLPPLALHL